MAEIVFMEMVVAAETEVIVSMEQEGLVALEKMVKMVKL